MYTHTHTQVRYGMSCEALDEIASGDLHVVPNLFFRQLNAILLFHSWSEYAVHIVPCFVLANYMLFAMWWLRYVGSLKLQVSFAKEPHKRDDILQKRLIILRSLLLIATPCLICDVSMSYVCLVISCMIIVWVQMTRCALLVYLWAYGSKSKQLWVSGYVASVPRLCC